MLVQKEEKALDPVSVCRKRRATLMSADREKEDTTTTPTERLQLVGEARKSRATAGKEEKMERKV